MTIKLIGLPTLLVNHCTMRGPPPETKERFHTNRTCINPKLSEKIKST